MDSPYDELDITENIDINDLDENMRGIFLLLKECKDKSLVDDFIVFAGKRQEERKELEECEEPGYYSREEVPHTEPLKIVPDRTWVYQQDHQPVPHTEPLKIEHGRGYTKKGTTKKFKGQLKLDRSRTYESIMKGIREHTDYDDETYVNSSDEETSDAISYSETHSSDMEDYTPPVRNKYPYEGNGFVMYTNVYYDIKGGSVASENLSLEDKQSRIRIILSNEIESPFIDETHTFNSVCTVHTSLADKKKETSLEGQYNLLECVQYCREHGLDIIVWRVEDLTYDINILGNFYCVMQSSGINVYVIHSDSIVNLSEFLLGSLQQKMLEIESKCLLDFEEKNKKQNLKDIMRQKGEVDSDLEIFKKGKGGDKWRERYAYYFTHGFYTWIKEKTGGEDDFATKTWKKKYGKGALALTKEMVEDTNFPIWNGKTKFTDSMITKTKRNCRHIKDVFLNMDEPVELEENGKVLPDSISEKVMSHFSDYYSETPPTYYLKDDSDHYYIVGEGGYRTKHKK